MLAWSEAGALCAADPARPGECCAWYHRPWPLFRALGLVSSAALHQHALGVSLAAAARAGAQRVLVCGSADEALPALVVAAFAAAGVEPALSMLDRCRTPLRLGAQYAAHHGIALETCHADILEFEHRAAFDLVCTHAFLGYF
ncbi:MAG: hypothetical protein RKL32_08945, partial [Gammaproteobacteria bacterium]